jgi:NAD(P)-dependent dehydrogenase (short-subunit alcohol dehydrogenase family)
MTGPQSSYLQTLAQEAEHEVRIIEATDDVKSTLPSLRLAISRRTSLARWPGSYQTVYNASKSFIQSFSQALTDELRDSAITVTALMPGPTDTNFFHRAKMDETPVGKMSKDDPAQVARQGFEALMRGDQKVVGGSISSKLFGTVTRVLPDSVKAVGSRILSVPLNH